MIVLRNFVCINRFLKTKEYCITTTLSVLGSLQQWLPLVPGLPVCTCHSSHEEADSTFPLLGLALCPALNTEYDQSDTMPVPDPAFKSGSLCFHPLGKVIIESQSSCRKARYHVQGAWMMRPHMPRDHMEANQESRNLRKAFLDLPDQSVC